MATAKRILSRLKGKRIIRRSDQHDTSGRQKASIIELIGFPKHAEKNDGRGSPRASGGAQPATGERLTASPPRGSDCASLYKEEPKYEPSCEPLAEHSEKQTSIEGREFWAKAIAPLVLPEHETVTFENDRLVLHNGTRAEWLKRFDGDETRLDLALVTAANYVQPSGNKSLEVQVAAQLARQVSDKLDKDARYAATTKAKQQAKPRTLSRFGAAP